MVARVDGAEPRRATSTATRTPPYRMSAARAPDGTLDRYLYGPRGNLYAILRGGRALPRRHATRSARRASSSTPTGAVVKRLEYDAYGVTTDLDPAFFLPIGYAGGLRDPVTGLVRFGLRDYEPQSGRFTARDPAMFEGSPRSLYGYAYNSPVSFHDPGGTASLSARRLRSASAAAARSTSIRARSSTASKPFITGPVLRGRRRPRWRRRGRRCSRRRRRRPASTRWPSSTGRSGPVSGKVGGEFDLICGTGKAKIGGQARAGPGRSRLRRRVERGGGEQGGRQDRGQGRTQGLRGRAELIRDP